MKTPLLLLPLLGTLLLPVAVASAQADGHAVADEKPALQEKARRLREDAEAIRHAAEAQLAVAKQACWKKFLVSACLDDAAQASRSEKSRAHAKDKEAREIEREIRKREFAEREAKRLEQAPPTDTQ
jgi:hypothetical protein